MPNVVPMKMSVFSLFSQGLTCENRFVRLELPTTDGKRYIAKFLVLEQQPEIIGQPALRHLKLYRITLPGDVYTVRHHADL